MAKKISVIFCWVWLLCGMCPQLAFAVREAQVLPFERLMMSPREPLSTSDIEELRVIQRDYEKNIDFIAGPALHHVPKVIHFIWIGPKEFPRESIENLESWRRFHPKWEIFFWTDSKDRPLPMPGMKRKLIQKYDFGPFIDLIASTNQWAEKADLIRYMILYKEGGIYSDHDVVALRSLSCLAKNFDFVIGLEWFNYHPWMNSWVTPCNAIIISRPQHPVLGETISRIVRCWDEVARRFPGKDSLGVIQRVIARTFDGMAISAKKFCNLPGNRDLILPNSYFYPYPAFDKATAAELEKSGYVYAIHKYEGTWKHKHVEE